MVKGILTSAGAMRPALAMHAVLANNLANANTAGFRQDRVAFQQIAGSLQVKNLETMMASAPEMTTHLDSTAGAYEVTERPLDVAIQGDGFFVVQSPDGERLTRGGQFRLAEDGSLITAQGFPVQSEGGALTLPTDQPITINTAGEIQSGETTVGRLRIVGVTEGQALEHVGGGLMKADGELTAATEARVLQGVLEGANVEAVQAMVDMIALLRHFEMNQKALQAQDESLGNLLSWVRA